MPDEIMQTEEQPRGWWYAVLDFITTLFWRVLEAAYPICYRMGIRTMRVGLRARWLGRRIWQPVRAWVEQMIEKYWRPSRQRSREERAAFRRDRKRAHRWIRYTWKRNRLLGVWRAIRMPFQLLRRHHRVLLGVFDIVLPVAAAIALTLIIRYWRSATFALRLTYHGQYVGNIADEAVFDRALALADGRVLNVETDFSFDRTPVLTLTMAQPDNLLDANQLCDIILQSYGDEVTQLTGIYVDGVFVGSTDSAKAVNGILQGILDGYVTEEANTTLRNVTTSFVQNVEMIDGLYPISTKLTQAQIQTVLTDPHAGEEYYVVQPDDTLTGIAQAYKITRQQLLQLNPTISADAIKVGTKLLVKASPSYLDVQMTCEEVQEEAIPFDEKEVQDPTLNEGVNGIKIVGKDGIRRITYSVTYVNGQKIEPSTKLSEEVVQEPVTQILAVGTRKPDANVKPGSANSRGYVWPLPSSYSVGETYGYQEGRFHNGIDIYGDYGAPIVAAKGGTVVEAEPSGYNGGWGLNVLIDHGNGYMTRYAHCSAIAVTVGETISQGQTIGYVGSTGYSTCNHLHFEVYENGSRVDPYPYIAG